MPQYKPVKYWNFKLDVISFTTITSAWPRSPQQSSNSELFILFILTPLLTHKHGSHESWFYNILYKINGLQFGEWKWSFYETCATRIKKNACSANVSLHINKYEHPGWKCLRRHGSIFRNMSSFHCWLKPSCKCGSAKVEQKIRPNLNCF